MKRADLSRRSLLGLIAASQLIACGATDRPPPGAPTPLEASSMDFDRYVQKVQHDWGVPGVAVAMVQGDHATKVQGYGVLRAGRPERVNGDTVFQIASITKPFVSLLSAMVAAEGRWSLEDRVVERFEGFRRPDPNEARELRIRDLLSHRSGLRTAEGNLLCIDSDLDDAAILSRLGFFRGTGPRSRFGYSNLMYLAAGRGLQSALGGPWPEFLRQKLLGPLGMTRSVVGTAALRSLSNVASPHATVGGPPRPLAIYPVDNLLPAGGLASSAADLSHWLRLLVNQGRFEGRQIVPPEVLNETWTPQTAIPIAQPDPTDAFALFLHAMNRRVSHADYGLGWVILQDRGQRVIQHGGLLPGSTAAIAFVPERRVGIAVLTNGEIPPAAHAILFRGLDELLGREPIDWSAEYLAAPAPPGPPSGAPAEAGPRRDLIGRYRCEEYGSAEVRADRNTLVLQLEHHPDTTCQLVAVEGDRYACLWSRPGIVGGEIAFTRTGSAPASFELTFAPFFDPHRYVFTRDAPAPPRSPAQRSVNADVKKAISRHSPRVSSLQSIPMASSSPCGLKLLMSQASSFSFLQMPSSTGWTIPSPGRHLPTQYHTSS